MNHPILFMLLILPSSSLLLYLYFNFSVDNDLHNSDHFLFLLSFHDFNCNDYRKQYYIYEKADWTTFTLNLDITPNMIDSDINRAVAKITDCIMNVANISIPKSSGYSKKHTKLWWNEACKQAK